MKTPAEKDFEKAHKVFNRDHAHLREQLLESIAQPSIENEPQAEYEEAYAPKRKEPFLRGIIMTSRFMKIAAAFVVLLIIFGAISIFTNSNTPLTSLAFGKVLSQIKKSNYTFDLRILTNENGEEVEGITNHVKIRQPGIMRLDSPEVNISTITDFNTGEFMLLWHKQKAVQTNIPEITHEPLVEESPFNMFTAPIESLWNLQDGTETELGEKEINGQKAYGFEVQQKYESISYNIIVWADSQTGSPIRVEIIITNPENPAESITMILDNFTMDVELDADQFVLRVPDGYVHAYQESLENTIKGTESSPEAKKILQSLELFNEGKEDQAIEMMLSVNWAEPIEFSDEIYLFTTTEKGYIQLTAEDQNNVFQENEKTAKPLSSLCRKMWEIAETARTETDYAKAEEYLNTTLKLGRLLNRNPNLTITTIMRGHSLQIRSLTELEALYQESGEQEKLKQTKANNENVKAERQALIERNTL